MIKAIVFDWYGVCTKEGWTNYVAKEIALKYDLLEERVKLVLKGLFPQFVTGEIQPAAYLVELSRQLGVNVDSEFFNLLPELNPEVLALIQKLKQKYTTILFTGNFKPMFENYKKKINMQDYFDHLFLSYEYGRRKNDPEMWDLILEKTHLSPEEIVFIDDNPKYIEVARNKGIRSILFTNQEEKEILKAIN